MRGKFVAYYRVSTDKQGKSGLGLDAQRNAVLDYLDRGKWELLGEFTEIESGKRSDRPELETAIAFAKKHCARLIIAKLDRLSRNVAFISALMERKVDFIAVDNPHATKFNLHILAAVVEFERDAISRRTREALAAAKARGVKFGNYARISAAKQAATAARAESVRPAIEATAHLSLQGAADELNRRSLTTAGGKAWHATAAPGASLVFEPRHQAFSRPLNGLLAYLLGWAEILWTACTRPQSRLGHQERQSNWATSGRCRDGKSNSAASTGPHRHQQDGCDRRRRDCHRSTGPG
jgi:DNA invertase Pin-like site-specific DNA recombinase